MEEDFRAEMREVVDRIKRGEALASDLPKPPKPKKAKAPGPGRGSNLRGRPKDEPKFDYKAIVEYYREQQTTQTAVAKHFNCSVQTVRNALKALEPGYKPNPGAQKQKVCAQGHNEWVTTKRGVRFCLPCRQEYQRNWWRERNGLQRNEGHSTDPA